MGERATYARQWFGQAIRGFGSTRRQQGLVLSAVAILALGGYGSWLRASEIPFRRAVTTLPWNLIGVSVSDYLVPPLAAFGIVLGVLFLFNVVVAPYRLALAEERQHRVDVADAVAAAGKAVAEDRLVELGRRFRDGHALRELMKGAVARQGPAFQLEYDEWYDQTEAFLNKEFPDCAALFVQRLPTAYTYAGDSAVARLMSIMDSKLAALTDIIKLKAK